MTGPEAVDTALAALLSGAPKAGRTFVAWRRGQRAQRFDPGEIRRLQERRLRALVEHARLTVPYYRRLFAAAGISAGDIRTLEDLTRVPVTTRAALQAAGEEAYRSETFDRARLRRSQTAGSSGRPLTVWRDPASAPLRSARFIRALGAAGYRIGQPVLQVATNRRDRAPPTPSWSPTLRSFTDDPPEQQLAAFERHRPVIVYGWTTPVRQFAELLRTAGASSHRPRAVVTTAETLDAATRSLIEDAFGCDLYDLYGSTEFGTVAWECRERTGYHLAEDAFVAELLDHDGREGVVVLTQLELTAMPLIRYAIGDFAAWGPAEPCPCGCRFRKLARIEGRLIDAVRLRDGRELSPYRLTRPVRDVPGFARYQIIQDGIDAFRVLLQPANGTADATGQAVRQAILAVVGAQARVEVEWVATLEPPSGRKFRIVECRVGRQEPPAPPERSPCGAGPDQVQLQEKEEV